MNIKNTFVIAGFLFTSVFLYPERTPDPEMARLYSRYAWSAYQEQNWVEFVHLVQKGVEFGPENPDLLSFQGLIHDRNREFPLARVKYEAAYRSPGTTEYLSRRELLASLSSIHYRLGEYERQIDLFDTAGELNREDPAFLFYTILSLYSLQRKDEAIALAEEGVYRFQDQRFLILLSAWEETSGYPAILNEFLDRQGILYPDLMARMILQAEGDAEALSFQYISRIRDFNSWYFTERQLGLDGEFILYGQGEEQGRIWPGQVIRKAWEELPFREGTGRLPRPLLIDQSGDGIEDWEIRQEEESVLWIRDENQDGAADFTLRWADLRTPLTIEFFGRDAIYRCYYDDYPSVERIEVEGPDRTRREYLYLPGSYELPVFPDSDMTWFNALDLRDRTIPAWLRSGEAQHLAASYSLKDSVTDPEFRLFREYTVISGAIRRFREDSNFDGHFDRTVLLRDWLPYEGYRDLNLDGQFDVIELYNNGRLIGLEAQGDNSRIEEYYDLWNSKRYQLWNFDQTSFYDAVLIQNSDLSWNEHRLDSTILMQPGITE